MTRRPPWIIWGYILWDLWRLVLLTTAVLVTVIAFAAAVKPLADGKLDPAQTLKFMLFAMPPMLQYALPFAACFGATLAYHRLTADNEVVACHAGGMSHRTLVFPALASGVALSLILLVLTNRVIPSFLRRMGELISQDVSKMIVHQIKNGEAVKFGSDKFLFADEVVEQGPEAATGAFQKLWLGGVLLVKLDKQGAVNEQASAREATAWLRRVEGASEEDRNGGKAAGSMTEVLIRPRDGVFQQEGKQRGQIAQTMQRFVIPNSFSDNPKYLTDAQLHDLYAHPEGIQSVDEKRRELAMTLAQVETIDRLRELLSRSGHAEMFDGSGQRVVLKAADIRARRANTRAVARSGPRDPRRWQVLPEKRGQPIIVERTLSVGTLQSQKAMAAEIDLPKPSSAASTGPAFSGDSEAGRARVAMTLKMLEVSAQDLDENGELIAPTVEPEEQEAAAAPGVINEWTLSDLTLKDDPAKEMLGVGSYALMSTAKDRIEGRQGDRESRAPARDAIQRARDGLFAEVNDLLREVFSKVQERLAISAACLVMVLVGTVMAMRLRDSLPLTIYLWAFFPALATVIAISAGQKIAHERGLVGLPVLWAGVALLGVYGGWQFARLVKR